MSLLHQIRKVVNSRLCCVRFEGIIALLGSLMSLIRDAVIRISASSCSKEMQTVVISGGRGEEVSRIYLPVNLSNEYKQREKVWLPFK